MSNKRPLPLLNKYLRQRYSTYSKSDIPANEIVDIACCSRREKKMSQQLSAVDLIWQRARECSHWMTFEFGWANVFVVIVDDVGRRGLRRQWSDSCDYILRCRFLRACDFTAFTTQILRWWSLEEAALGRCTAYTFIALLLLLLLLCISSHLITGYLRARDCRDCRAGSHVCAWELRANRFTETKNFMHWMLCAKRVSLHERIQFDEGFSLILSTLFFFSAQKRINVSCTQPFSMCQQRVVRSIHDLKWHVCVIYSVVECTQRNGAENKQWTTKTSKNTNWVRIKRKQKRKKKTILLPLETWAIFFLLLLLSNLMWRSL